MDSSNNSSGQDANNRPPADHSSDNGGRDRTHENYGGRGNH